MKDVKTFTSSLNEQLIIYLPELLRKVVNV